MVGSPLELNRLWWDERVPLHLTSPFYDLDRFRAGGSTLLPYEPEEIGAVAGRQLLHLQCHIGTDTLSWARLGAEVTGLDFSEPAIAAARQLAGDVGLSARFVEAEVRGARAAVGREFDIVYTGKGALEWLPDIQEWARVVASLLRPGGILYLVEIHPLSDAMADERPVLECEYEEGVAMEVDAPGDYADRSARGVHTTTIEWIHPLGAVVSALASSGLAVELLRERSETFFPRFPTLERRDDLVWEPAPGQPRWPLSYSLRARRPGR